MKAVTEPAWMRDVETRLAEGKATAGRGDVQTTAFLPWLRALLQRCTVRNERLRLCETLTLGGRRSVALIECDGQRFLAGMSAGGVETLVPVDGATKPGDAR